MVLRDVAMSLSFNNQQEAFYFPVLPEIIDISDGQNSKTYTTVGLGEINVIKDPKLTVFKFESEFPMQAYPYVYRPEILMRPEEYINYINEWRKTKRPMRYIYTGTSFDINEAVSIEQFDWKEVGGSPGDIQYSITLKKYVFYAARRAEVVKAAGSATAIIQKSAPKRPSDKVPPGTYKIAPGDSLWAISKKNLGKGERWKEIQKLNGLTDAQVKKLPTGMTLKMPG